MLGIVCNRVRIRGIRQHIIYNTRFYLITICINYRVCVCVCVLIYFTFSVRVCVLLLHFNQTKSNNMEGYSRIFQ